jgi:gamma-glutamyl-gamma-aminobutyraldehyde dehydrogenase
VRERAAVLLRLADLVARDADLLAALDSADSGRPITEVRTGDLPGAEESLRWFAEAADKLTTPVTTHSPEALSFVLREPVGVGAAVLPWNYPLAMAAWKIGPALAAGNALLLKPADATPRSVLHLARLAAEAGLPAGVLSVLPGTGPETGAALVAHRAVGAVSFTGSTATGRAILAAAAGANLAKVGLEMGGKSPQVLFADALQVGDHLIDHMVEAAFLAGGQNCTAGSRVLVHADVVDEVLARFTARADALAVGLPADPATEVGPLVDARAAARVAGLVDRALAAGAHRASTRTAAPRELPAGGAWCAPTVLTGVAADAEIEQAEVFGPVVTVSTFTDDRAALARANDTPYGLAASVWTADLDRALWAADGLSAGLVSVNSYSEGDMGTPFGGFGWSGHGGKEKSLAAFDQWTRQKSVWVRRRPIG